MSVNSQTLVKGEYPVILMLSDRPETGPMWVFSLQRKNWTVILEASWDKAIDRLQEQIPDLVLIDTQRPNESILALIRKLRAETVTPILPSGPAGSPRFFESSAQVSPPSIDL